MEIKKVGKIKEGEEKESDRFERETSPSPCVGGLGGGGGGSSREMDDGVCCQEKELGGLGWGKLGLGERVLVGQRRLGGICMYRVREQGGQLTGD